MKKYLSLLFFSFAFLILKSQLFNLNITEGFGSGTYTKGDTVFIWSNPKYNSSTFNQWQGSATKYMLEGNEWMTRIVVPKSDTISSINASASFHNLSSNVNIGFQKILLPGVDDKVFKQNFKEVYYQIPKNPSGIIFCFHGTNGSGRSFKTHFEKNSFFKSGAKRNYIMIATDANEQTNGDQDDDGKFGWQISNPLTDDESDNIDIKVIKALRDAFIKQHNLPFNLPTFSVGVSNGADFADLCAAALNFKASANISGNGLKDLYEKRSNAAPVIFVQSSNKQNESSKYERTYDNYKSLVNRGICSKFYGQITTPVYSERFIRTTVLMVSKENSDSIFQRIKRHPTLRDSINRILIAQSTELPENLFKNLEVSSKSILDYKNQIKKMNVDHKFSSHFNNRILDFFDSQLKNINSTLVNTKKPNVKIYPNPTSSNFHVTNTGIKTSVSVLSASGELIYEVAGTSEIDMKPFPNGVYFIKMVDSERTTEKIFVKEH
tara:strand:- start:3881 stop:5359 length:1479 start_codon:yes stop_codon:yes gene_type:complete